MTLLDTAALQQKLYEKASAYQPVFGECTRLDDRCTSAFFAMPRHRFAGRFRPLDRLGGRVFDANDPEDAGEAYRNIPLMYVDEQGRNYDASSSEPAFILHLLTLLDLQPGQRVLEIGSGTGWLIHMIAHVIGDTGAAHGVEIQPDLHRLAVDARDEFEMANLELHNDSGYTFSSRRPFDRIIVTASTFSLPSTLFSLLAEGGRLIVPLKNKGFSEELFVLDRQGEKLVSRAARLCRFVGMQGDDRRSVTVGGDAGDELLEKANHLLATGSSYEQPFEFGERDEIADQYAALHFSSFLSKTETNFHVFHLSVPGRLENRSYIANPCYCLLSEDARYLETFQAGVIHGFGQASEGSLFLDAYRRWGQLDKPHGAHFSVTIVEEENRDLMSEPRSNQWWEQRGRYRLLWALPGSGTASAP